MVAEINEKPWRAAARLASELRLSFRVLLEGENSPTEWSPWIVFTALNYVELSPIGPVRKSDVLWVEILNIETIRQGRLLADKKVDHTKEMARILDEERVPWEARPECITRIRLCP